MKFISIVSFYFHFFLFSNRQFGINSFPCENDDTLNPSIVAKFPIAAWGHHCNSILYVVQIYRIKMFASLKQKIKEETGNDVCAATAAFPAHRRSSSIFSNLSNNNNHSGSATDLSQNGSVSSSLHSNGTYLNNNNNINSINNNNNSIPNRFTTITSQLDQLNGIICQKNDEIVELIDKIQEVEAKCTKLSSECDALAAIRDRLEQSNSQLEDALKVAQEQKELIHSEQDKIQNLQAQEITKLKNLLHFREQACVIDILLFFRLLFSSCQAKSLVKLSKLTNSQSVNRLNFTRDLHFIGR